MGTISDRIVIGSYGLSYFRVSKSEIVDLDSPIYYYVNCVGIDRRVWVQPRPFEEEVVKKSYGRLEIESGEDGEKYTVNCREGSHLHELVESKTVGEIMVCEGEEGREEGSLYSVWEIEKLQTGQEGAQCRITNVVTRQTLAPDSRQEDDLPGYYHRSSVLRLKKEAKLGNQFVIVNDDNVNLLAVYDSNQESYTLKF
jgi:hypothetical protein